MLGLIMISDERSDQTGGQSADRAGGVEALPKEREHNHRQIGRSRDGESERDQKGDVGIFAQQDRDADRDRADDERRDPRHAHFFARARSVPW